VAILATAVLTGSAYAQRQGGFGRFGGGGGAGQLLRMAEVQTELKLTDDQKTKIATFLESQRGQGRGQGGGQGLSPEERAQRRAEQRAKETEELKKILNEDQMKRLKQLQLQRQGMAALAETEVQSELKLTADQKSKVEAALQEQRQAMRDAFQDGGGDPQAARAKMEELRKKTNEKLEALLTEEQKSQWKAMLGAPFTFPAQTFPGRARRNDNA
jgi:hypothetical protein